MMMFWCRTFCCLAIYYGSYIPKHSPYHDSTSHLMNWYFFLDEGSFFPSWDPLLKLYFVWLHICLHQQLAILDFSLCKVFKNAKWFSSLPILTSFRSGCPWTCVKYGDECRDVRHVRFKVELALTRNDDWCISATMIMRNLYKAWAEIEAKSS